MKTAKIYLYPGLGVVLLAILPGLLTFMIYIRVAPAGWRQQHTDSCAYDYSITPTGTYEYYCTDMINYSWDQFCYACTTTACPHDRVIDLGTTPNDEMMSITKKPDSICGPCNSGGGPGQYTMCN